MPIRTRVLALLLVVYLCICPAVAAPAPYDMVFTPEETARLDSLRNLMTHYQEAGDYDQAFRVGQAYNHFRILLQEKSLNYRNHSRVVLALCLLCTVLTIAALCLLYLHNLRAHRQRMEEERRRAEDLLQHTQTDLATQNRFLSHFDRNIRKPTEEILQHAEHIFAPDVTVDPVTQSESYHILRDRSSELLNMMEALLEDCKGHARRSKNSLLRLVVIGVCLAGLDAPVTASSVYNPNPLHDTLMPHNHAAYCYREDGIAPYDLAGYHVDLLQHEEAARSYRRHLLLVVICMMVAFVGFLIMRVQEGRRYAREWSQQMADTAEATRLAAEAKVHKERFLEQVSHELRTPLNAILGFSDILCDEVMSKMLPEEEKEDCRRRGLQGAHDLRLMVEGALEVCAMDAERQPVTHEECSLPTLLMEARCDCLSQKAEGVEIGVSLNGEPIPDGAKDEYNDVAVVTDRALLKRAVSLLMDNACKFTNQGRIDLDASAYGKGWLITVTDTGCGVPPEKAEEIFHLFVKLDEFVAGIGLGLCLCRSTMHLLGGEVYMDKQYQGGSRFVIRI